MNTYLGIELGSTRIKAVQIDESYRVVSSGEYSWASRYEDGIWTYDLADALAGLRHVLGSAAAPDSVRCMGISGMMHGYLAFDSDWKLLTPFRTWQNTTTGQAAAELTQRFGFNIPQRWSIAHLYQAMLDREPHVERIAHITTLAGYLHYRLTGVNAVGVGEASGMFPVDSDTLTYRSDMLACFEELSKGQPWRIGDLLPKPLPAGADAGCLTEEGASLLGGLLPAGIPFAPAEGDAGTGMTATNAVASGTGNISAGTSIFSMVVLDKPLSRVYPEIDMVTTPGGKPVAMVHCNNCTGDMNAWVRVLGEGVSLMGVETDPGALFRALYNKSLEGDPDCGGITVYNYLAGEGVTHLDAGRPLVVRGPDSAFTLANFLRAQLYATMATLKLGMDILSRERVAIKSLTGHGGLFQTPVVGQTYMAAACNAPITCMEHAGSGGPYGMALLAAYAHAGRGDTLEAFLADRVFCDAEAVTVCPEREVVEGFGRYMERFKTGLAVERAAVDYL